MLIQIYNIICTYVKRILISELILFAVRLIIFHCFQSADALPEILHISYTRIIAFTYPMTSPCSHAFLKCLYFRLINLITSYPIRVVLFLSSKRLTSLYLPFINWLILFNFSTFFFIVLNFLLIRTYRLTEHIDPICNFERFENVCFLWLLLLF